MRYSRQALLENQAAEEEAKKMLQQYSKDYSNRVQQYNMPSDNEIKQEELVLPLAEAEKQLDDELLKQANEIANKYPSGYEKRFAKTKQYLNKI